jgi:hypothetical protein
MDLYDNSQSIGKCLSTQYISLLIIMQALKNKIKHHLTALE